jgi:hypothetical protein
MLPMDHIRLEGQIRDLPIHRHPRFFHYVSAGIRAACKAGHLVPAFPQFQAKIAHQHLRAAGGIQANIREQNLHIVDNG